MDGKSTDIGDHVQRLPVSRLLRLGASDLKAPGSRNGAKLAPATFDFEVSAPDGIRTCDRKFERLLSFATGLRERAKRGIVIDVDDSL